MLSKPYSAPGSPRHLVVAFDTAERGWNHCPRHAGSVPMAASGGLSSSTMCWPRARSPSPTHSRARHALPSPPQGAHHQLQAIVMYGSTPYRVALFTGELPDLPHHPTDGPRARPTGAMPGRWGRAHAGPPSPRAAVGHELGATHVPFLA
ncbi:F-box only protein 13-like [Panicum miliaceum]|uniref:F-box only protein 13-like n=1 Tax=Panicum miliaceum TaxID=4540 RepID=A0A3L6Q3G9_PANMI|nr:F-box only protein 13-like [Panicum miliaceum]